MIKEENIIGKKFGRLFVLSKAAPNKTVQGYNIRRFNVHCDCGRKKVVNGSALISENTKSCGCLQREKTIAASLTHGMTRRVDGTRKNFHPLYTTWESMRKRCNNPKCKCYPRYGGKGIKVCERWNSFSVFVEDMGERPAGCSLDRIDSKGDYEPENCRWATLSEQANNRSCVWKVDFQGKPHSLRELSKATGISARTLWDRNSRGVDMFTPSRELKRS